MRKPQSWAPRPAIKPFAVIATAGALLTCTLAAAAPAAAGEPLASQCVIGSSTTIDDVDLATTRVQVRTRITRTTDSKVTARSVVTVQVAGEIRVTATADTCPNATSNVVTLVKTIRISEKRRAAVTRTVTIRTTRGDARSRGKVTARNAATRAAAAAATKVAKASARTTAAAAAQALSSSSTGTNDPSLPVVVTPSAAEIETFRRQLRDELLRLHNEERQKAGAPVLTSLAPVTARAQEWADHLATTHSAADFTNGAAWPHSPTVGAYSVPGLEVCSGNVGGIGENLGMSGWLRPPFSAAVAAGFAARRMESWMNSPGHRNQLLTAGHTRSGFGVALVPGPSAGSFGLVVVAEFYSGSCPEIAG